MSDGGYYSFRVRADDDVMLPEFFLALARGEDSFSMSVLNLEAFTAKLLAHGVHVLTATKLDEYDEEIPAVTLDLPTGDPKDTREHPRLLPPEEPSGHDR